MKQRLLSGWTFMRVLYLIMGATLVIQAIMAHQYAISLLGLYFVAMSLLGIGCMGGQCYTPPVAKSKPIGNAQDVTYEEVKS